MWFIQNKVYIYVQVNRIKYRNIIQKCIYRIQYRNKYTQNEVYNYMQICMYVCIYSIYRERIPYIDNRIQYRNIYVYVVYIEQSIYASIYKVKK